MNGIWSFFSPRTATTLPPNYQITTLKLAPISLMARYYATRVPDRIISLMEWKILLGHM
jgi:hypothetical protein